MNPDIDVRLNIAQPQTIFIGRKQNSRKLHTWPKCMHMHRVSGGKDSRRKIAVTAIANYERNHCIFDLL